MIIAELGLNHLGSVKLAEMYIQGISNTSVNGITFQIREDGYYVDKKSHLELNIGDYTHLSNLVRSSNMKFGLAIADINMVDELNPYTDFYKVIRNDIANIELTDKLIATGKRIIVSTGLSSEDDIQAFMQRYPNNKNIVLNHTQLSYDINDCNLSAIDTMKLKYNCDVSYGSHCDNINTLYMSLCYNPSDILFYVKLDGTGNFPDDKHSVVLHSVGQVSANLNNLHHAIGKGVKTKMVNKIESKIETPYEKSERLKNEDADSWDNVMYG